MRLEGISHATIFLGIVHFMLATLSHSLPLSTRSRWIVDAKSGQRVKLSCVNWAAHLHVMIPEGLHKQPLSQIASNVSSMGFNCVRLTWATHMLTRPSNSALTVAQSLRQWYLKAAIAGIARNNPQLLNLTLLDAQKAVVRELGAHNLMVVLDNHVSLPLWCCGDNDGNGFFGDTHFDPGEWLQGLSMMAEHYKGNQNVVGMSIRNELRGPKQNVEEWYEYMQQGSTAVHKKNQDVLVIVSGLGFDTDLTFLKRRGLAVKLDNKLVYEAHWYAFGDPVEHWLLRPNQICANVTRSFARQSAFLIAHACPFPLFLSEFGTNQRDYIEAENRYLSCLLADVAEKDLDWALWTLQGSYMLREGKLELEETYGVLDANWDQIRNSTMQARLQLVKQMIHDPFSNEPEHYLIHHLKSGQCVGAENGSIYVGDCQKKWSRWSYDRDQGGGRLIKPLGGSGCLTVAGEGLPATLSRDCSCRWRTVSISQLHLAAKDAHGKTLCLEWNSSNSTMVTNKCACLGDCLQDIPNPDRQWFKLVPTNKKVE